MDYSNIPTFNNRFLIKRRTQIIPNKNIFEISQQNSIVKSQNDENGGQSKKDNLIDTIKKIMIKKTFSIGDVHCIAHYLNTLDEFVNYIKSNHENYHDLIHEIALYIKGIFYNKNDIIVKYGEKGENFYIILEGTVSVLKPKEVRIEISEEEYLLYLAKCKKYEEFDIIQHCMSVNKSVFNIDEDWINWLKSKERNLSAEIILKLNRKSEFFMQLNKESSNENNKLSVSSDEYMKRIGLVKLNESKGQEKLVTIYQYQKIVKKFTGGKFGELRSEKNNMKRTATIIAENDCLLGILDQMSFKNCLKQSNDKIIRKSVDFFLSSKLFYGFNRMLFEIKLYHLFVHKKIERYERVIIEGEEPKYLYLIKKGEFEVTGRMNLLEFSDYVYYFGKVKMNNKFEDHIEKEKIENDAKFKKYISQKHLVKISIAKTGDVLGLEDMIYQDKYAFSAECVTAQTEVFVLDKKNFEIILQNYQEIKKNYSNFMNTKIDYLVQRLISMKETKVNIFNYKNDENLNRRTIYMKEKEAKQKNHKNFSPHYEIDFSMSSPENTEKKLQFNKSLPLKNKEFNKSLEINNNNKAGFTQNMMKNLKNPNVSQSNILSSIKNSDSPVKIAKKRIGNSSVDFHNKILLEDGIITKTYSSESKISIGINETKEIIYKGDAYLKQAIQLRTVSVKSKLSSNKFLSKLKNLMEKKKNTSNKSTSVNFKDLKLGTIENSNDYIDKPMLNVCSQVNMSPIKRDSFISKLNLYQDNIPNLKSGMIMSSEYSLNKDQSRIMTLKQNKESMKTIKKDKNVNDEATLSPANDKKLNPVNIFKERQSQSRIKRYKRHVKLLSDNSNLEDVLKHYKLF